MNCVSSAPCAVRAQPPAPGSPEAADEECGGGSLPTLVAMTGPFRMDLCIVQLNDLPDDSRLARGLPPRSAHTLFTALPGHASVVATERSAHAASLHYPSLVICAHVAVRQSGGPLLIYALFVLHCRMLSTWLMPRLDLRLDCADVRGGSISAASALAPLAIALPPDEVPEMAKEDLLAPPAHPTHDLASSRGDGVAQTAARLLFTPPPCVGAPLARPSPAESARSPSPSSCSPRPPLLSADMLPPTFTEAYCADLAVLAYRQCPGPQPTALSPLDDGDGDSEALRAASQVLVVADARALYTLTVRDAAILWTAQFLRAWQSVLPGRAQQIRSLALEAPLAAYYAHLAVLEARRGEHSAPLAASPARCPLPAMLPPPEQCSDETSTLSLGPREAPLAEEEISKPGFVIQLSRLQLNIQDPAVKGHCASDPLALYYFTPALTRFGVQAVWYCWRTWRTCCQSPS